MLKNSSHNYIFWNAINLMLSYSSWKFEFESGGTPFFGRKRLIKNPLDRLYCFNFNTQSTMRGQQCTTLSGPLLSPLKRRTVTLQAGASSSADTPYHPGVIHLLGVVTWPAHMPLWPGHLQNFWAQGDFARSAKSMGEWCAFICIHSHNIMIHVFSKNPTDSYT